MKNSPTWEDDAENPPLSARRAVKLANELKNFLVKDSEIWEWKYESASLLQGLVVGKWYWLIQYKAHLKSGGLGGGQPNLSLVVLMDGTVVKPHPPEPAKTKSAPKKRTRK